MAKFFAFLIFLKLARLLANKIIVVMNHKRITNQFEECFTIRENLYYKVRSVIYIVIILIGTILTIIEHESVLVEVLFLGCTLCLIYFCIQTMKNKAIVTPDSITITSFPKRSQKLPIKDITHVVRRKVDLIQNIQVYSGHKMLFEYNETSINALLFENYIKKNQWNLE